MILVLIGFIHLSETGKEGFMVIGHPQAVQWPYAVLAKYRWGSTRNGAQVRDLWYRENMLISLISMVY